MAPADTPSAGLMPAAELDIEVVYCAGRGQVDSTRLKLPAGTCVREAVDASGVLQRHPGIDHPRTGLDAGIWGRRADPSEALADGDRVEIYRPLLIEPMESRRLRQRGPRPKNPAAAMRVPRS